MRILVVCQYYYPERIVITSICEDLVRRGHEVFVVTGQPNYGYGKIAPGYENIHDEVINGVKVHRCKLYPRGDSKISLIRNYLSFNRSSKKYIKTVKEQFDLVYSMELSPVIGVEAANIYAKRHHVPHLLHCLDLWPESVVATGAFKKNSLAYHFLFHWSKKIYDRATKILVSSPSFERYFNETLRLKKQLLFVPQPPLVPKATIQPVVYSTAYNFVYAGNVGSLQLVENFVSACQAFKHRNDFAFYIVGNGTRVPVVKEMIEKMGLKDIVHYHEMVSSEEAAAYYPNATALIVPLANTQSPVSKTIPIKLISSLYFGRPILACIKGDGGTVLHRAGGSVFADENPQDIAKAMEEMIEMPKDKLDKMGTNNKKYFLANFEFGKVMDQIESEFKEAIKG
jgi:glycosyltransferase involved in cell wall biosynthesis